MLQPAWCLHEGVLVPAPIVVNASHALQEPARAGARAQQTRRRLPPLCYAPARLSSRPRHCLMKGSRRSQDSARAVRLRTAGALQEGAFLDEAAEEPALAGPGAAPGGDAAAVAAERLYAAELARELRAAGDDVREGPPGAARGDAAGEDLEGSSGDDAAPAAAHPGAGAGGAVERGARKRKAAPAEAAAAGGAEDEDEAMAAVMMPRKARHLYASIQKRRGAKRARTAELERRAAALAAAGAS